MFYEKNIFIGQICDMEKNCFVDALNNKWLIVSKLKWGMDGG